MKKWAAFISICVILLCLFFLYSLKPENTHEQQVIKKEKITLWAYSSSLIELATQYEKKHPDIKIVKRLLKNPAILLEELSAAQSSGNPPDIAEISSFYGIYPFIESKAIQPVSEYLTPEFAENIPAAIEKRFLANQVLWAIPMSYEIPLLYVNEAILASDNEALEGLQHPEQFMQKIAALHPTDLNWKVNADLLYPWYLLNIQRETKESTPQLIEHYQDFLFHTNHLALTQFVNGEGGILISSSGNLQLIEKLIGNKFKWRIVPFPLPPEKIIANGHGLIVFDKPQLNADTIRSFTHYLQDKEQLIMLAHNESMIPASKQVIHDPNYLNVYRYYHGYQAIIQDSLKANGMRLHPSDEQNWTQLVQTYENLD